MFSRAAEYAVRAVVLLAQLQDQGPVDNKTLAARAQVPPSYLAKVMQSLVGAGIVRSRRGVKGGFSLHQPTSEIRVLDVVNSVDPITRIKGCPLSLQSHCQVLCPMHSRLDQAMAEVESILGASTIAELLADTSRPTPMLETASFLPDRGLCKAPANIEGTG